MVMKKYLKNYKLLFTTLLVFCLDSSPSALARDLHYVAELHPPVIAEYEGAEIIVLFTKSNMKNDIHNAHVPDGEVFYISRRPFIPKLNYVWKIEDEEVSSVFFYEWKTQPKAGKSLFLLTRNRLSNNSFSGYEYSVIEFPLIKEGSQLSLVFFPGDLQESTLTNCRDGRDLSSGKTVTCPYKTAASVKNYLSSRDTNK